MSKRRDRDTPAVPKTLLGPHTEAVHRKINLMTMGMIQTCLPFEHDADQIIKWLFDPEDIALLRRAAGLSVETIGYGHRWQICNDLLVSNINFKEKGIFPPRHVHLQQGCELLQIYIEKARDIIQQFGVVKHVFDWLNANATAGAVRYYWPSILSLVPDEARDAFAVKSTRFRDPPGIERLLSLMRESAGTVGAANLLPAYVKRPSTFILCFTERTIEREGREITIPSMDLLL